MLHKTKEIVNVWKIIYNYKYQNVYIGNWLIRPFAYKLSLD